MEVEIDGGDRRFIRSYAAFCGELLKAKMEVEVPASSEHAYSGDGNGFISDRTFGHMCMKR